MYKVCHIFHMCLTKKILKHNSALSALISYASVLDKSLEITFHWLSYIFSYGFDT